ncbi:hypothetical protein IJ765_01135 [Candidatus Saccharibacteria bacterium]|nr:hypothetical protein [Candidatus Saccharibacteria bacterium]
MGGSKKEKQRLSLKRVLKGVKGIKAWQLVLILIPMLFLTATFLRFDHIEMTRLRNIVEETDASGDGVQTAAAVDELKKFVFSHTVINITEQNGLNIVYFGTGPFYLSNQYYQKAAAILAEAEARAADDSNPNGNIYAAAMAVCKPQAIANRWVWNSPGYIACMTGEINKYPASENITETIKADLPNPALYRNEFVSPVWTPTASGFCSLISLVLIAWILVRFFGWLVIKIAIAVLK